MNTCNKAWWTARAIAITWLTGGSATVVLLAWYAAQGVPVATPN